MWQHRLVRTSFVAVLLLAPACGCQLLHPQSPMSVEVRDAETLAPIDGARVRVWHNAAHAEVTAGTTGPDGKAQIPSPPNEESPLVFEMAAKGYSSRQTDRPVERTPSHVVLEMFADPRPVLEFVVPNGYKGMVQATVRIQSDYKYPPGLRLFSYPVPPSAVVEAVLPPIFGRSVTPDIRFRFADGTPISRTAKDFEVGCRWLKADPDSQYIFVIGTQYEADETRRTIQKVSGGSRAISPISGIGPPPLR